MCSLLTGENVYMTPMQRRAIRLAREVLEGTLNPKNLTDQDWALLLLAAQNKNSFADPAKVCKAIVYYFETKQGLFADSGNVSDNSQNPSCEQSSILCSSIKGFKANFAETHDTENL